VNDLCLALRRLVRAPGFFVSAVLTLAIGMGANAFVYSAVNGLLVRPIPLIDADRIVWIFARAAETGDREPLSGEEAEAVQAGAFDVLTVIGDRGLVREIGGRHDRWRGIAVSRGIFDVLGVVPVAGNADVAPGPPRIAISYERWQKDFDGDASILEREVAFADNKRFVVAAILPPGLEFPFARAPHRGNGAGFVPGIQDFWILESGDASGGGPAIARLRTGETPEQAQARVSAVASPRSANVPRAPRRLEVVTLRHHSLGNLAPALVIVQIFAALVLLVACANLANLMLARAAAGRDETAVRVALGASPRALARLYGAEVFLISLFGAVLGSVLARGAHAGLMLVAPRQQVFLDRVQFDWSVYALLGTFCIGATVLFGLVPAGIRWRQALGKGPGSTRLHSRDSRSVQVFVVAQVALSIALLTGAAALRESLHRVLSVDSGYDMRGVVSAEVLLYVPGREVLPAIDDLVQRLRQQPEVQAVGLIHSTPLTGKWTFRDPFEMLEPGGTVVTPPIAGAFVAYDYFDAMGIPILAGRNFRREEFTSPRPPALIINDAAARMLYPGRNPLGARVRMHGATREIVAVVKDTRDDRLETAPEPRWYQPVILGSSQVIVRGRSTAVQTMAVVRRELGRSDSRLILETLEPLETIAADSLVERRLAAQLVTTFALVAVTLAVVGLHGVASYAAVRRRREFAIRAAIGATRPRLVRMVLGGTLGITTIGGAAGVLLSVAVGRSVQAMLFETVPAQPWTLVAAASGLAAVALLATLHPAWRAGSADPATLLRSE
jgi:predicted permease